MLLTEYDEKLHLKNVYREGREEGYSEGQEDASERINTLNELLKRDNRLEDLFRSFSDKEYQEKLFREYDL